MTELKNLLQEIETAGARLVAVSKTHSPTAILELYERGLRDFGENRVQELTDKYEQLPKDIRWHFIGHLQTNKVRAIAPFVHLLHSGDSPRLLREVDKQAAANGRVIDCLLQFKIAAEETKYGLDWDEAEALLKSAEYRSLRNIRITGVMGMATFTDDREQVRREFRLLKSCFDRLKTSYFSTADYFREVSMGMSGDYALALEEGSTMVRIGSLLFGERTYP